MKEIQLTKGYVAQVDDEDYEWLSQYKWQANDYHKNHVIAKGQINGRYTQMHRLILGLTDPTIICDHIDNNSLNNQRSNLRPATRHQNTMNSRKLQGNTTSKYKGVSFHARPRRWVAAIIPNGKKIQIGTYLTEIEAAIAYNKAAIKYFGEYAWLNKIDQGRSAFCQTAIL
jgi:hypothetical protein